MKMLQQNTLKNFNYMKTNKNVALVLSSGGARGLAEIGVIEALIKNGFNITSVSGSSIGAMVGGLYAMGKLDNYSQWVKTFDRKAILGLMDISIRNQGLLKGERVLEKMKDFIPDMNIEDMNIPFVAIATDILNQKAVVFEKGSYYEAIRASIAIPAVFTPFKYNDTFLVDGGVLNPVPIEYVSRTPNDILVVVNLYGGNENNMGENIVSNNPQSIYNVKRVINKLSRRIRNNNKRSVGYVSILSTSLSYMMQKNAKLNIEKYKPDIIINIPHDHANTFDFHKADRLIKYGEKVANIEIQNYLTNTSK